MTQAYTILDPRNRRKKFPLVMIEWVDARNDSGWETFHDSKACGLATCVSVGLIIEKTKEKIVLVTSWGTDDWALANGRLVIPNTWQVKITPLGVVDVV